MASIKTSTCGRLVGARGLDFAWLNHANFTTSLAKHFGETTKVTGALKSM